MSKLAKTVEIKCFGILKPNKKLKRTKKVLNEERSHWNYVRKHLNSPTYHSSLHRWLVGMKWQPTLLIQLINARGNNIKLVLKELLLYILTMWWLPEGSSWEYAFVLPTSELAQGYRVLLGGVYWKHEKANILTPEIHRARDKRARNK